MNIKFTGTCFSSFLQNYVNMDIDHDDVGKYSFCPSNAESNVMSYSTSYNIVCLSSVLRLRSLCGSFGHHCSYYLSIHPPWVPFLSLSEDEVQESVRVNAEGARPHFLVVEGGEPAQLLSSLSPFAIAKGFKIISSGFTSIKLLCTGQFVVQCTSQKASEALC